MARSELSRQAHRFAAKMQQLLNGTIAPGAQIGGGEGGRRFRPALEDVIEFLVDEQLVRPREGWLGALDRSRREFREIQLRAAVRRDPEVARQALMGLAR